MDRTWGRLLSLKIHEPISVRYLEYCIRVKFELVKRSGFPSYSAYNVGSVLVFEFHFHQCEMDFELYSIHAYTQEQCTAYTLGLLKSCVYTTLWRGASNILFHYDSVHTASKQHMTNKMPCNVCQHTFCVYKIPYT